MGHLLWEGRRNRPAKRAVKFIFSDTIVQKFRLTPERLLEAIELPGGIMPISGKIWDAALERARPALRLLAGQRVPYRLWKRVDPSDVVQVALKEAHEKRAQFRGSSEQQLLAWLRPILVHRLYDELRRCRAKKQDIGKDRSLDDVFNEATSRVRTEAAVSATPSRELIRRETIDRVSQALEKLPKNQSLVVMLLHFHGLKVSEVASMMGRSNAAVAALLHRALASLGKALKDTV
jgi:RNA polymerase sigma-70 factor (ECF subfamily)